MQQLSNLDASFLHLENDHSPMHVGGVMIFDVPAQGQMTLERLREHVKSRLQTARVFRQRVVMPVWHLDAPWWVEDEHFDLNNHMRHEVVDSPLTNKGLSTLSADFFSKHLRRDRPLWELVFVEQASKSAPRKNQKGAAFALLIKVHHAALDGVSAEAVIAGLLDMSVTPRVLPADEWQPETPPGQAELLLRQLWLVPEWKMQGRNLLHTGRVLGWRFLKRTVSRDERTLPYYFTAPRTIFNAPINSERLYCTAELSLSRIKSLKNQLPGVTVNDVVLGICAGAVRRYLSDDGAMPTRSLVAMAPISKRNVDQKGASGNMVSSMLIRLATDIDNPLERLKKIHDNARCAKEYNREMAIESMLDYLPHAASAHFLSRYKKSNAARLVPPMFNMVVTNVPGSPVPMYLDGAKMRGFTGMAGIYDGMALTLVVLSYCDTLTISITSSPEVLQDPERLAGYMTEALDELEQAVNQTAASSELITANSLSGIQVGA